MNAIAFPYGDFTDTPSSAFPLHLLPAGDKGSVAASAPCLALDSGAGSRDVAGEGAITPAIVNEVAADIGQREALLDRAMGAGRKRKSSEKLRRGRLPSAGLAFVARGAKGELVGTVRLWDVSLGEGGRALLLGPLAVSPEVKSSGVGSALMRHAIAEARRLGHGSILLVGDAAYYARFGFSDVKTAQLSMPGPYERDRFLALELTEGALESACGVLKAAGRRIRTQSSAMAA